MLLQSTPAPYTWYYITDDSPSFIFLCYSLLQAMRWDRERPVCWELGLKLTTISFIDSSANHILDKSLGVVKCLVLSTAPKIFRSLSCKTTKIFTYEKLQPGGIFCHFCDYVDTQINTQPMGRKESDLIQSMRSQIDFKRCCLHLFWSPNLPHLLQLFRRTLQEDSFCREARELFCGLHLTLHRHKGEQIMTGYSLLGELVL